MAATSEPAEAIWIVESSDDGVHWQTFWVSPTGPIAHSFGEAVRFVRMGQMAHDVLEMTCGLPPRTWRLRNARTGEFIVGEVPA